MMDKLWDDPQNILCADCNQQNPQNINVNFEVIICSSCAIIHRKLCCGAFRVIDISSRVNAIVLDFSNFTGNHKSNQLLENSIPAFINKPDHNSPHVLKEQWIFAKYERKEYAQNTFSQIWYHNVDIKTGWLWKKEKNTSGPLFRQRYFILDRSGECFSYHLHASDTKPKFKAHIDDVLVYLNPELINEPNSMQIVFKKDGHRRSIFVYSENSEDIYNWYMAIRSVKWTIFRYLNHYIETEILYKLVPHGYLKQGWLYKTGNTALGRVLFRWFCLESYNLVYSEHPLDPFPKGEISLVSKNFFIIKVLYEKDHSIADDTFCFSLKMPDRTYYFASTNIDDRKHWIEKIRQVINDSKEEAVHRF